jgi:hypothetical protein
MKISLVALVASVVCGCGVKGDPLPPEKPSELGRGRPTYKRATENIKVDHKRPVKQDEEDEERDEERD